MTRGSPGFSVKMGIIGEKRGKGGLLGKHMKSLRANEHIVLVQYRDINEGKPSPKSTAQSSVLPSAFSPSPNSYAFRNAGSDPAISDI